MGDLNVYESTRSAISVSRFHGSKIVKPLVNYIIVYTHALCIPADLSAHVYSFVEMTM